MSSNTLSVRALPDVVRTLAFGSISGTYAAVGSAFTHPARILIFTNLTAGNVMFSFDGVNDHVPVAAGAQLKIDFGSNRSEIGGVWNIGQNTTIYVKDITAPTSGAVYVSLFYGAGVSV